MSDWTPTSVELPDEGEVVLTLSEGGMESKLARQGRLWFFEDFSMYVYYTPKYWKKL